MSWLKRLFGLKKAEIDLSPEIEEKMPIKPKEPVQREIRWRCDHCGGHIYYDDKYTKQIGKYYHRVCWKEVVKKTWQS